MGDVNADSTVGVEDAVIVLTFYAQQSAGLQPSFSEDAAINAALFEAADVNKDGVVGVEDAVAILTYYAQQSAGLHPSWGSQPDDTTTTTTTTTTTETTTTTTETTTTTTTIVTTPSEETLLQMAQDTVDAINQERANNGLQALTVLDALGEPAAIRAKELEQEFSHIRPDGTAVFSILEEYQIEYMTAAENIGIGYQSAEAAIIGWMNSEGHRANILSADYSKLAIRIYIGADGTYYWCVIFIG